MPDFEIAASTSLGSSALFGVRHSRFLKDRLAVEADFELRFGAGLKILFGGLGARVDVVDHLVLDRFLSGKSEHDIQVTAGLLVGF